MAGDGAKEQQQGGSNNNSELAARGTTSEKPVKVLPCPRCESMNTKFCYYNNYSVTQPRHFCRQCQRYWTAGGTLRNVPVGGGSRKKNRHHPRPLTSEPYRCFTPPPHHPLPPPAGHFQQMLTSQEIMLQHQFPPGGYSTQAYLPLPPSSEPVMYGTGGVVPGGFFPAAAPSSEPPAFGDGSVVKSEFWPPQGSSMLLNLGLNSHHRKMVVWDPPAEEVKPSPVGMKINGSSPPHGSSTIEEEGSTPTNGYSNNGYHEEETAVSSMWGTMNEIDTIFQ